MFGNMPNMIIVCGLQVACRGNEAEGTFTAYFGDEPVEIPACNDCGVYLQEQIQALDNATGYEVE